MAETLVAWVRHLGRRRPGWRAPPWEDGAYVEPRIRRPRDLQVCVEFDDVQSRPGLGGYDQDGNEQEYVDMSGTTPEPRRALLAGTDAPAIWQRYKDRFAQHGIVYGAESKDGRVVDGILLGIGVVLVGPSLNGQSFPTALVAAARRANVPYLSMAQEWLPIEGFLCGVSLPPLGAAPPAAPARDRLPPPPRPVLEKAQVPPAAALPPPHQRPRLDPAVREDVLTGIIGDEPYRDDTDAVLDLWSWMEKNASECACDTEAMDRMLASGVRQKLGIVQGEDGARRVNAAVRAAAQERVTAFLRARSPAGESPAPSSEPLSATPSAWLFTYLAAHPDARVSQVVVAHRKEFGPEVPEEQLRQSIGVVRRDLGITWKDAMLILDAEKYEAACAKHGVEPQIPPGTLLTDPPDDPVSAPLLPLSTEAPPTSPPSSESPPVGPAPVPSPARVRGDLLASKLATALSPGTLTHKRTEAVIQVLIERPDLSNDEIRAAIPEGILGSDPSALSLARMMLGITRVPGSRALAIDAEKWRAACAARGIEKEPPLALVPVALDPPPVNVPAPDLPPVPVPAASDEGSGGIPPEALAGALLAPTIPLDDAGYAPLDDAGYGMLHRRRSNAPVPVREPAEVPPPAPPVPSGVRLSWMTEDLCAAIAAVRAFLAPSDLRYLAIGPPGRLRYEQSRVVREEVWTRTDGTAEVRRTLVESKEWLTVALRAAIAEVRVHFPRSGIVELTVRPDGVCADLVETCVGEVAA